MAADLWGHLVGACAKVAQHAAWPSTNARWKTVRRILLKAAKDTVPRANQEDDDTRDDWPGWSWPAPRLDAAQSLPYLAFRLGRADRLISAALRRLARDESHPVRFNLALELAVLARPASDLMWQLIDRIIESEPRFSVLDALLHSMDRLPMECAGKIIPRLDLIARRVLQSAPAENSVHETLAQIYLFRFLRAGDTECEEFIRTLIAECDSERANRALPAQLHACRAGGWMTAGDGVKQDLEADSVRTRTWKFLSDLLATAQAKLTVVREAWRKLHQEHQPAGEAAKPLQERLDGTTRLVDGIAMQLYFASGASHEGSEDDGGLTGPQLRRFWQEASPLLAALASEIHPHTAHQVVQTLYHLLPCAPRDVFLLAAKSILSSKPAGFQYESLAVGDVVRLIQRALADHREIFQTGAERLSALLEVLDLFVEAGWAEARQLTHRLEEIYR
jgi:hypothetical protein